jgi:1,4-alpha-glucan branching enzyme
MRVRGNGFWEIFVPEARAGDKYKYEIVGPDGHLLPLKSDPLAFAAEVRLQNGFDRGRSRHISNNRNPHLSASNLYC